MTIFMRLINQEDKFDGLLDAARAIRSGSSTPYTYEVDAGDFSKIPRSPFAYWISKRIRGLFVEIESFELEDRTARAGLQTSDDFRFLRLKWEVLSEKGRGDWRALAKGGTHAPFYADVYLTVNWTDFGREIKNFSDLKTGKIISYVRNEDFYFRTGIFQTLRAAFLAPHITPPGCVFGDNGTQAFAPKQDVLPILAILNSKPADFLHKLLLGRVGYALYRNGTLSRLPMPAMTITETAKLSYLSSRAWKLRRALDSVHETSHAFVLPEVLRPRVGSYDPSWIEVELANIQAEIDDIAFNLYGFSDADRAAALASSGSANEDVSDATEDADGSEDDDGAEAVDQTDGLLSWAAGVAFGRFDWRLATGEREAPPEPEPFDPLPVKSPGMVPDGAEPFNAHSGILLDDQEHPKDLARLIEEVLAHVEVPAPADLRRWLQRDFFALHLKQYSKSRRKGPIYWPLSTTSGSYTLWLYYPDLTSQTLYSAVNDFVEPKLKQVTREADALRDKGASRSRDDEKAFEALQSLELELIELRDTILQIAPSYRPNHDDGVQITAAPLWQLFRHKPWQKILKDTWAKLEKGDYDWAHLAFTYWPDRVREKCKTDKSFAIAHGLEQLYVEAAPKAPTARGRKKGGAA